MSNTHIKIAHPDWLKEDLLVSSSIENTLKMYRQGVLPESIAGFGIVLASKRPLRAVYGSDLRAAWKLLLMALAAKIEATVWPLRLRLSKYRRLEKEADEIEIGEKE